MTYRNGIKEYFSTGILFGIPMGLFFGLVHLNLIVGLIGGIMSGALFAFLIFLFCKVMEKKFIKKHEEISRERKIICDGGATYEGLGGWLFFTENALEFYPHKINYSFDFMCRCTDSNGGKVFRHRHSPAREFHDEGVVFVFDDCFEHGFCSFHSIDVV